MATKTYIVQFDREGCIGAASCTIASKNWIMANDGKADFKDMKHNEKTDFFEAEISEEQLKEYTEAAQSCPVNVIHIIDKETGKKII